VHSDFLQGCGKPAKKHTQWFLNASIPFSSIASGMCMLTRIRPGADGATRVVVACQNDAFGEIGVLEIPAGGAMIIQPKALAGIIKNQGAPVRITRHWRLTNLHAWLSDCKIITFTHSIVTAA
jgi:hypothetical protein